MGYVSVKEWLRSYQGLKFEYDSWNEKHARLENEQYIPAMRASDGAKRSSGTSDRMGSSTLARIEFEDETSGKITEIKGKMKAIEQAIAELPDPIHRGVLVQRYIIGAEGYKVQAWRLIAQKLYHKDDESSCKRVQRTHREAIGILAVKYPDINEERSTNDA